MQSSNRLHSEKALGKLSYQLCGPSQALATPLPCKLGRFGAHLAPCHAAAGPVCGGRVVHPAPGAALPVWRPPRFHVRRLRPRGSRAPAAGRKVGGWALVRSSSPQQRVTCCASLELECVWRGGALLGAVPQLRDSRACDRPSTCLPRSVTLLHWQRFVAL